MILPVKVSYLSINSIFTFCQLNIVNIVKSLSYPFSTWCPLKEGADQQILKRGGPLGWPPWLADEENFRFQMV